MQKQSPTRGRAGLTMIEMLVVIGICGVLAVMLLPMALRARASARSVICADNLKGLGQAVAMSTAQSNGYLPDAYYAFEGHSGTYQVTLKPAQGAWVNDLFQKEIKGVMTCPADDKPVDITLNTAGGQATTVPASYAYNVALPLMFRNNTRVRQPLNTVSFYDGDLTGVVGEWHHNVGWARDTIRNRHRTGANYLFLDGHVETCGEFPDLAFEGGNVWVASARDTRPRPEPTLIPGGNGSGTKPPVTPPPTDPPVVFTIDDGDVIPGEDVTVTITCLGAAFQYGEGGPRIPVTAYYKLNDDNRVKITNDVLGGESITLVVPGGTSIATAGKTSQHFSSDHSSDDGSGHTWVLRDGDHVPSLAGFAGQRSIQEFLTDYVNPNGEVTIGNNDCIFLFELSNQTDYQRYSHADFQDLVILVHFERKPRGIGGKININPNNNSTYEFRLELPEGAALTRDDLHADRTRAGQEGFNPNYLEYTGPATLVYVKPKGNGNQNGLLVDGSPYRLLNKYRYTITSTQMNVHLYNDKRNGQGKAMGKWWIDIVASEARIQQGN